MEFEGDYYEVFMESKLFLEKVQFPPRCRKVTDQELSQYPTLKRAIELASKNGDASLKVPPEEWENAVGFIQGSGCDCVEFNGSYYRVLFATA